MANPATARSRQWRAFPELNLNASLSLGSFSSIFLSINPDERGKRKIEEKETARTP
jgi:hypothetical protein